MISSAHAVSAPLLSITLLAVLIIFPALAEARPPAPPIGHIADRHIHHDRAAKIHHITKRNIRAHKHAARIGHITSRGKHHRGPRR
ncbi:MAG: hypothetical protein AAFZ92_10260 [Pseudomonadota bacterium]